MPLFEKKVELLQERLDDLSVEREEVSMTVGEAELLLEGFKEWLKENKRIYKLTELIPKAKKAEGELAYITHGQYVKHWGREPKDAILTKDGKRVRWEYALDELAGELGLEDGEAVRDAITKAREFKADMVAIETELENAVAEGKDIDDKMEKVSVYLGRREQVSDIHEERTPQARGSDEAKQAKSVLSFPYVVPWMSDPGRHDIRGVDMAKRNARRKAKNSREAKNASPRISTMRG